MQKSLTSAMLADALHGESRVGSVEFCPETSDQMGLLIGNGIRYFQRLLFEQAHLSSTQAKKR